jgi:hypothetical protein
MVARAASIHVDERLHFTVIGVIECEPSCQSETTLKLIGSAVSDLASMPVIASTEVSAKTGSFIVAGAIVVGHEGQPAIPPLNRAVRLEIRNPRCAALNRDLMVKEFARDTYGHFLDVGVMKLSCR